MTYQDLKASYDKLAQLGFPKRRYIGWLFDVERGKTQVLEDDSTVRYMMHPDDLIEFVQQTFGAMPALDVARKILHTKIDNMHRQKVYGFQLYAKLGKLFDTADLTHYWDIYETGR